MEIVTMALQKIRGGFRRAAFVARLFFIGWFCVEKVPVTLRAAVSPVTDQVRQLSSVEAAERIDALRTEIAFHDELYFRKSAPVISDSAYDQLKRKLAALELAFPDAAKGTGDFQPGIGDDRSGSFATYRHRVRMLSLNKSYSESELRAFDARLVKQLGRPVLDYVVEPKFDGLAISVTFEKGKLVRAVTRGNGLEGDDVTANLLTIHSLPRSLRPVATDGAVNSVPDVIELRGEVYLMFAEFERINRERESAGETPFAIPRNLAAGTLKQSDPNEVAKRRLEIVFYGMGACEPAKVRPTSQLDLLRQLHAWGLPTIDAPRPARGPEEMWRAVQAVGRERARLGFPIDGVVVKLNDVTLQDQIGVTTQAPLWAIAYKFEPARIETQVRAITLQVGRTGVLTPVAELVPVKIAGSTVARASLFNRDEIARRDIRVGDFVYVEKAGEIIPAISSVDRTRRAPDVVPYVFPLACPVCGTTLVQSVAEAAMRCPNTNCSAQIKRRVEYFASKSRVNISGLGPATVERLVDEGTVKDVADLYQLRSEDWISPSGSGGKSADRLLAAIEQSKRAELWRFIAGLGIPQVGEVGARCLGKHFGGLSQLADAKSEDFFREGRTVIPGISEETARAILSHFALPENRRVVDRLLAAGIQPAISPTAGGGALPAPSG
jgi:DNA ligase (NAD+)